MNLRSALVACLITAAGFAHAATELVIATVNNGQMIQMQKLSRHFEQANPDIRLKWVTLDEGTLRKRVTADITAKRGEFDIMTIGMYETPIWGKKGWLVEIRPDAAYDVDDLLPSIRGGLSLQGRLYAAPFYGESSMVMYRRDLAAAAGIDIPHRPSWEQIRLAAQKLHNPDKGVYGICLRGKPGWGDNMALVSTMVNSFGGQWFDMQWRPQLTSEPWRKAVSSYVELLRSYGPPQPEANSFNELLALFNEGRCGIWIDATIAASFVTDPKQNAFAAKVGYAQAPTAVTARGANWLWAWSLAIPAGSRKVEAAQRFVLWATSRDYVRLVARESGWARVPTGTRKSTYSTIEFLGAARYATAELQALHSADSNLATLPPSPYTGIQFVAIPEFQAIGEAVGQQVAAALSGLVSVDQALKTSQRLAEDEIRPSRKP